MNNYNLMEMELFKPLNHFKNGLINDLSLLKEKPYSYTINNKYIVMGLRVTFKNSLIIKYCPYIVSFGCLSADGLKNKANVEKVRGDLKPLHIGLKLIEDLSENEIFKLLCNELVSDTDKKGLKKELNKRLKKQNI